MHENTFGFAILPNTNLTYREDTPFWPFPVAWCQENPTQIHETIPIEGTQTDWSVAVLVEGPVTTDDVHENFQDDNGSPSPLEAGVGGFPAVPFAAPTHTCGLANGLPCALPLDDSMKSVKSHLRLHGHRHPQRQNVQCPWMGCFDTLQWMNIPRHIQSVHLGIRFKCFNCGKSYTRPEGLARHTTLLKCNDINTCEGVGNRGELTWVTRLRPNGA